MAIKSADDKNLVSYFYAKLVKILNYLEYTYQRVESLSVDPSKLTSEQLEIWDSFAVRFARSSDIFLSKFIKAVVKRDDPAFDGGFRDYLHQAEKLAVLKNVPQWLEIRQLRNVTVHEYSDSDLKEIFKKLFTYAPRLLELRTALAELFHEAIST